MTTDRLTLGTLLGLFNVSGLYTLGFSFIFGMCELIKVIAEFNRAHLTVPYSTMGDILWG